MAMPLALVWDLIAEDHASGVFKKVGGEAAASSKETEGFGKAFLGAGVLIGAAAVGISAVAVKMASDFQESTTKLVTGAGESTKNLDMVKQGLLDMAPAVGMGPTALAKAMFLVESAGFHGADGLNVMKAAAEGAKIGGADATVVADGLTTALKDYHLPASDAAAVTSQLVATVAAGKTNMADLSASLSNVLPFAASLGIKFKDVTGAMATMTGEGIDAATSSTMLKFTMMSLANETPKGAKALKSVGLSSAEVHDSLAKNGLIGTLQMVTDEVGKKFPKGSAGYTAAIASIVGGTRGMGATLALTGQNMATYRANIKAIGGAATEAGGHVKGWALTQEDFAAVMARGKAQVEAWFITLGQKLLPVLTKVALFILDTVVPAVKVFLSFLNGNDTGVDGPFRQMAVAGVALREVLLKVVGFIKADVIPVIAAVVVAVKHFVTEFQNGTGAGGKFRAALVSLWNGALVPFAKFLVGTVIPAIAHFAKALADNRGKIAVIAGVITAILLPALIRMAVQATISGAETAAVWVMLQASAIRSTAITAAQFVIQGAKWVLAGFTAMANAAIVVAGWIAMSAGAVAATVAAVAQFILQEIRWIALGVTAMASAAVIATAWLISMGPIVLVIAAVIGLGILIATHMDLIKGWISSAWHWVEGVTSTVWGAISSFFSSVGSRISSAIQVVLGVVKTVFSYTPLGFVVMHFGAIVDFFRAIPGRILGALGSLGGLLRGAGAAIMDGLLGGISAGFDKIKNVVGGIASWISSHKGPIEYDRQLLIPHGHAIMAGLNDGLTAGFGKVQGNVSGMAGRLSIGSPSFAAASITSASGTGAATSADIARLGDRIEAVSLAQTRLQQTMQRQMAGVR
jgi:TP901 family phage tail tape measure protein